MTDKLVLTVPGNEYILAVRKHKKVEWSPAADITAHELATLTPLLINMAFHPTEYWEDFIPTEAKRHFKISDY